MRPTLDIMALIEAMERDVQSTLPDLSQPDFEDARRVHDWRTHVPELVRDHWNAIDDQTRLFVWFVACKEANAEEWD